MKELVTRGFVTIATGDDWYYQIAVNLLDSYRYTTKNPLPFAIIADHENEMTRKFDKTIILDNPTCSYNDKLRLGELCPFDETVFIDADCLAYDDLNKIFDCFEKESDFCCIGTTAPLTEECNGWFSLLTFPEETNSNDGIIDQKTAKAKLSYTVNMHGGMYFIRKTEITRNVFQEASIYAKDYSKYKFRLFEKPADEPVLALAMAMNNCKPIHHDSFALLCFWRNPYMKLNMLKNKAHYKNKKIQLVHWGTVATKTAVYKKQVDQLHIKIHNIKGIKSFYINVTNTIRCYLYYAKQFLYCLKQKLN